jgi:hypothetical protein
MKEAKKQAESELSRSEVAGIVKKMFRAPEQRELFGEE